MFLCVTPNTHSKSQLDTCLSSDSLVGVVEVHDVVHGLPCEAEVDHPVHQVEGDEHDGEDDAAVLVDITRPHPAQPRRGLRRQRGRGQRQQRRARVGAHVSALSLVTWQRVRAVVHCARQHAARVEPHTRLQRQKYKNNKVLVFKKTKLQ